MKTIFIRTGIFIMMLSVPYFAFTQNEWKNNCATVQPPTSIPLKPDTVIDDDAVIIIPTVFHVLTQGGAENISKSQILSAMEFLNQDFNRQNPDTLDIPAPFQTLRGNPKLEFRLARLDPQGNCTDGINRIYTPLTGAYDNFLQMQPNFSWDHTRYLNIYLLKWIDYQNYPLYNGASYIAPPDSGQNLPVQYDALLMRYDCIGNGTNGTPSGTLKNHGLSHEMGHNLALKHVYGLGPGCSDDDDVEDTPLQDVGNSECAFPHISCNNGPDGDMFNNFMDDFSPCTNMFSEGQVDRMRYCLTNNEWRTSLWTAENLAATGVEPLMPACANPPTADFGFGNYAGWLSAGQPILFYEAASVNATSYQWEFEGGIPATSTAVSPSVTFADTGLHTVKLMVINSFGYDSIEKLIMIKPAEVYYNYADNAMLESFENAIFNHQLPQWTLGGKEWSVTNLAAASGTNSIRLDSGFKYFSVFFTHILDLNQMPGTGRTLAFKVACGLSASGTIAGGLRVTWKRPFVYERPDMVGENTGGADCGVLHAEDALAPESLQTATTNSAFIPSSGQWKTIMLEIPDSLTGEIQIGFNWGSFTITNKLKGLFIDDIRLLGGTSGIGENVIAQLWKVFPNPAGQIITFDFGNGVMPDAEISIYNITGVLLKRFDISNTRQLQIPVNDIGSDGMYFFKVRTSDQQFFAGKFIIQR